MAEASFGLVKIKYKHADGSGKVYTAPSTPAAVINAADECKPGDVASDTVLAYLNAEYGGVLPDMGFKPDEGASIRVNAIEWAKHWRYQAVSVDDDGNEITDDVEGNPTQAS